MNLPVPPPPPPPVIPTKNPAAEAEAFLRAYGTTLLEEAMQRMLDASFAIATTPDVDPKTQDSFSAIQTPEAAAFLARILLGSGTITCRAAHGKLTDDDVMFLFHSVRPLLLLTELEPDLPAPPADTEQKRLFLQGICAELNGLSSLAAQSLGALEGFRLLAMYDQLNGCQVSSPEAVTQRMRMALLKYLHTLVDCDGHVTEQEDNCIVYLEERASQWIEDGVIIAKRFPQAAIRLRRSPFTRPEVVIESPVSGNRGGFGRREESARAVEEILQELWQMTGLASVKEEINSHINTLKVSAMRREVGLAEIKTTNHMVFTGNPGTGKTTVARLLARLYRELGIVSKGSLTEVDQSSLLAGYVGQTAIKTKEVLDNAKGGVLFIDEAYALTSGKAEDSFGKEAIDTLLKYMEDYRHDLIVIVAGYEQPMKDFLNANLGLKSRFNKFIAFSDYSAGELKTIFTGICQASGYVVSEELDCFLATSFQLMTEKKQAHFGNGRTVRNLFDRAVVRQANRLVEIRQPSHAQLMELTPADIREEDIQNVLR